MRLGRAKNLGYAFSGFTSGNKKKDAWLLPYKKIVEKITETIDLER